MPDTLTQRQQQVFDFICETIKGQGFAPSVREISKAFEFRSSKAATDHLQALVRKGYLEISRNTARGIRLLILPGIPVIGTVAAGSPIEAIENHEQRLQIPVGLFRQSPDYLLRVKGDSMRDALILDGDLLAVKKAQTAASGQIVVARLDNEVTVKRLKINRSSITLMPANLDYSPMRIRSEDFALEGIVCGVVRSVN